MLKALAEKMFIPLDEVDRYHPAHHSYKKGMSHKLCHAGDSYICVMGNIFEKQSYTGPLSTTPSPTLNNTCLLADNFTGNVIEITHHIPTSVTWIRVGLMLSQCQRQQAKIKLN